MANSDQFGLCGTARSYYHAIQVWAGGSKKTNNHRCKTCRWFCKGEEERPSRCGYPYSRRNPRQILSHNGNEKACFVWGKKW